MAVTIVHLSGPCIRIEGEYAIQRCSLCGAALVRSDCRNIAILGSSAPVTVDDVASFPVGEFVEVDAGNPTRLSVIPTGDKLPPNSCYKLELF